MSGIQLLPNLGDEEKGATASPLRLPRVAAAARLWRFLFPADVAVLGAEEATGLDWDAWPEALLPDAERAALPALDTLVGCVPWLANRSAHARARAAGLEVAGPPAEAVMRVHDKAFAFRAAEAGGLVPRELRGCTRVLGAEELTSPEAVLREIAACLASWPPWARDRPVLKPRLGTSGRGRVEGRAGRFDRDVLATALPRLRDQGGALLEPWLERERDFSVQLFVEKTGGVVLLGSLELLTGPTGGFRGHRGELDSRGRVFSGHADDEALREAGAALAAAARSGGFHGAAGLDAFRFRVPDADGDGTRLRPVVELNARFTLGTVAAGLLRRVLPSLRRELALDPGERRAFWFSLDRPRGGWAAAREAAGDASLWIPLFAEGDPVQPGLLFATESAAIDRAIGS